jgi:hypothetical protein
MRQQCVAPLFLSPCSKSKQPSSIYQQWWCLSSTSQLRVSPEKLFDYTQTDHNDNDFTIFESTNDQDEDDYNQKAIFGKYVIDQSHKKLVVKEDKSFL